MPVFICRACGTSYPDAQKPPSHCPICEDERQYVAEGGHSFTTLAALREEGYRNGFTAIEPGLTEIVTEPRFAIGQRMFLIESPHGNVLWDGLSFLDDATLQEIGRRGGARAIAVSHPHYYSSLVDYAEELDATLYIHEADRAHVQRPSPRITFYGGDTLAVQEDVILHRLGGHFAGAAVLEWRAPDGEGVILSGDTIQVMPDRRFVSFMYSYPNAVPLPASTVTRIARHMAGIDFSRMHGAFGRSVHGDAKACVQRSTERYVRMLEGHGEKT